MNPIHPVNKGILLAFLAGGIIGGIMMWQLDSMRFAQALLKQRENLIETVRPYLPQGASEYKAINGNIAAIKEKEIIIRADSVHVNPFETPGPELRTIVLTDNTKIYRRTPKDRAKLQEENEAFFGIPQDKKEELRLLPPDPFERIEVGRDILYAGQRIAAFAKENVKYSEKFEAQSIEFQAEE